MDAIEEQDNRGLESILGQERSVIYAGKIDGLSGTMSYL
ncbi:MAG: hypothetical protein QOJ51_2091 [Acidobacteriaceae bacterium]|nr:hypothetical protein [Acidobacteriaceae bacterium]